MFLDDDDDCIPSNLLPPRKCCRLTPDQKIVLFFYLGMTLKIEPDQECAVGKLWFWGSSRGRSWISWMSK